MAALLFSTTIQLRSLNKKAAYTRGGERISLRSDGCVACGARRNQRALCSEMGITDTHGRGSCWRACRLEDGASVHAFILDRKQRVLY